MSEAELSALFGRAVELDAAERARLLAEVGAADAELAGRLERLLAAESAGGAGVLDRSPWQALRDEGAAGDEVPEQLGAYRIVRELGRGGMGRVFLAEQRGLDFTRLVALKVVAPGVAGPEVERRFREERRILAGLEHPGIARLYDAGLAADGTWFLALEYVEGEDLLRFVRGRGLDARARIELFLQVLDAVDFAHRRLVVHRDLKPGNVLVGSDGVAKLLDFGISKILAPGEDESAASRTVTRAFTPAYASPEQLRGEPVTIASDVYSLGVILYEILAGRRPAAERAATGAAPDPPSSAARTNPGDAAPTTAETVPWRELAGDLDAIALKALRAEPESRYRSAAAFADDLRRWLAGEPVEARRGSRRYRLAKRIARHRVSIAAGAAVVLALAAGLAVAMVQRSRALAAQARAEETVADLHRLTQSMLFEIHQQVAPLPGSLTASGTIVRRATEVLERLSKSAGEDPRLLRDLAAGYEQLGFMLGTNPSLGRSLNRPRAAIEVLTRAVELRDRVAALPGATFADRLAAAEMPGLLARAQLRARDAQALATAHEGIARLQRLEADAPDRAFLRYRLAAAHTRARPVADQAEAREALGDPDLAAATRLWREFAAAPPASALADPAFPGEVANATLLLIVGGHLEEALRIANLALEVVARQPATTELETKTRARRRGLLLFQRAGILDQLDRPAESLADLREQLRIDAAAAIDPDDLLAETIRRLSTGQMAAEIAAKVGDLDLATQALGEADRWLTAAEERYGAESFAAGRIELGRSHGDVLAQQAARAAGAERGRLRASAITAYRDALALADRMGGALAMHGLEPERVEELRARLRELEAGDVAQRRKLSSSR